MEEVGRERKKAIYQTGKLEERVKKRRKGFREGQGDKRKKMMALKRKRKEEVKTQSLGMGFVFWGFGWLDFGLDGV